jgi:hypothetical protein
MKLAIVIAATKSYTYAMKSQAKRIAACLRLYPVADYKVFLCGDAHIETVAAWWHRELPNTQALVLGDLEEGGENYKQAAQLRIARMRSAMHEAALKWGADFVWSLDSDVLPPINALRAMHTALQFDGGWYQVAFCTYPNDMYLGGFGTPQQTILPNVYDDERELPAELKAEGDDLEKSFKSGVSTPEMLERMDALRKRIQELPPKGNVFALNGAEYRRRGWLEHAYPGIGIGAIVPSDWSGFGCNLMTRHAVELARFEGYTGEGTEDLFINWMRWHPAGIRICVIPHAPADHVLWRAKKKDAPKDAPEYEHLMPYHEATGECRGHLRTRRVKWEPELF